MESLIPYVKDGTTTNKWKNGICAMFKLDRDLMHYHLIEMTPDAKHYIIPYFNRDLGNLPVVAKGIVAYLINHYGRPEQDIFDGYNKLCFADYYKQEANKPGSFKRDLNAEFYSFHLVNEVNNVSGSESLSDFLPEDDWEIIKLYVASFFDYLKLKIDSAHTKQDYSNEHTKSISDDAEQQSRSDELTYFLCNDSMLCEIYDISSDIFNDTQNTFCRLVHSGDLSSLQIQPGNKKRLQYIVYRLSTCISPAWYTSVCDSMKWEPRKCSSPSESIKNGTHYDWSNRLQKIISNYKPIT